MTTSPPAARVLRVGRARRVVFGDAAADGFVPDDTATITRVDDETTLHVDGRELARVRVWPARFAVDVLLQDGSHVHGFGAAGQGPERMHQRLSLMNRDTIFFGIDGATYASFPIFWVRDVDRGAARVRAFFLRTSLPLDVTVHARAVCLSLRGGVDPSIAAHDAIDLVVVQGTPLQIASTLADLTGHAFVPPAWALGFHQSRWSYRTQQAVVDVAQRYRDEQLPADVVHLDIHSMHDFRVFTWDPTRFPAPSTMHRQLRALGFRTMAIVDPGVSDVTSPVRDALLRDDVVLRARDGSVLRGRVWPGDTIFPDFANARARALWSSFHAPLLDVGVAGFWNDMNDPVFRVGSERDPLDEGAVHTDGAPHARHRNAYATQMAEATVDALRAAHPQRRPFVLSRSGAPGIQRVAALWTGDNYSTWEQLQQSLHDVVQLGLCGVPLSGADIGGFGGRKGPYGIAKLRPPAELMTRWLELGALLPFARIHSVLYAPHQEPWCFGDDVLRVARKHLRRRYRLLLELLRLSREAAATGAPIVRPLWMHHDVPAAHDALAQTQFLVGDRLLAAPVLHAGARERAVFLPAGSWVDHDTGEVLRGDVVVTRKAPPGSPPLFTRADAPLVLCTPGRNAKDTLAGPLALEVIAPSAHGCSLEVTLEEDDALDATSVLSVQALDEGGAWRVDITRDDRGYTPPQTQLELRVPAAFATVRAADGTTRPLALRALHDEDRSAVLATTTIPLQTGSWRIE